MWHVIFYDASGIELGRLPIPAEGYLVISDDPSVTALPLPGVGPQAAYLYLTEGYPVLQDAGAGITLLDGAPLTQAAYVTHENVITIGPYTGYVFYQETADYSWDGGQAETAAAAATADPYAGTAQAQPSDSDPSADAYMQQQEAMAQDMENPASAYAGGEVVVPQIPEDMDSRATIAEPVGAGGIEVGSDGYEMASYLLKFVPRLGYLDGKEFLLNFDGYFDVGRAPEVEIHLDDPSVSRVHARLRVLEGGAVEIMDLRSTNGTFINGNQIKNDIASVGDIVRFGEVPFKIVPAAGEEKKSRVNPKLLALGGIALVVFFGLSFLGMKAIKERKARKFASSTLHKAAEQDVDNALKAKVAKLRTEAVELARMGKWEEVVQKYREALQYAPDDRDLMKALHHAQFELNNYKMYKEAMEYMGFRTHDNLEKALQLFRRIDPKSQYYQVEQSPLMMRLKQQLAAYYRNEAISANNARHQKQAYKNFCRYFELDSRVDGVPTEAKYRSIMKKLEKKLVHRDKDFVPCTAKRYLEPRLPVSEMWAQKAKQAIELKYPIKEVAKGVVIYMDGRAKEAIRYLNSLMKSRRFTKKHPDALAQIQDLTLQLNKISQAMEAGESFYQQDDISKAEHKWRVVLKLDAQVMPEGVKSRYRRSIASRLAAAYYRNGKTAMRAFRYEDAYQWFQKGLALDPDDTTDLTEGLKELEQKAMEFLSKARNKAEAGDVQGASELVKKVLAITSKDSLTHKEALKLKKALTSS